MPILKVTIGSPVREPLEWYCREGWRGALCVQEARICAHQIAKGVQLVSQTWAEGQSSFGGLLHWR